MGRLLRRGLISAQTSRDKQSENDHTRCRYRRLKTQARRPLKKSADLVSRLEFGLQIAPGYRLRTRYSTTGSICTRAAPMRS